MPKLTAPSLLLLLLAISSAAAAASGISPAPSPADDNDEQFCIEKFTDKCRSQVFRSVFQHTAVTWACCKNLEGVGKPCHDRLIRRINEAGERRLSEGSNGSSRVVNEEVVSGILSQGEKVWNDCVTLGLVLPPRIRWLP